MFGTSLHIITFCFIVIQIILIFPSFFLYLSKPDEKYRMRFLLLNFFFLMYNFSNGLIPGTTLPIDIKTQYYITFAIGIITSCFYFDYIYHEHNVRPFTYNLLKKLVLGLFAWYVVFFVIIYSATGNLSLSRYVFYSYPIGVGIGGIYKFIKWVGKTKYYIGNKYHLIKFYTGILGMFSLFSFPVILVMFPENQPLERSFYNLGFFALTFFYFYKIRYFNKPKDFDLPNNYTFNEIYDSLTNRQQEILKLLYKKQDKSYEELSSELFITLSTFSTHTAKLYKSFGLQNKTKNGLIDYLDSQKRDI